MCGIIGVELEQIRPEQMAKIKELFQQSAIRGIHATGFSYLRNGRVQTIKQHGNPESLFKHQDIEGCIENANLRLIAHTRYSTSDLKYNQPIGSGDMAIVHNGVISQAPPDLWKAIFELETETSNDSELILKCSEQGVHPLTKFKGSMAVCILTPDGVFAFRNQARPLWYAQEDNGVVFASTKDILLRSGFKDPHKCEMFTEYYVQKGDLIRKPFPIPAGVTDLQ